MTEMCELLEQFSDGELNDTEADRFRDHLADCEHCQRGLHELMQLERIVAQAELPRPAVVRDIRSARRLLRPALLAGVAVAAGLAALVLIRPCRAPEDKPAEIALASTRAVEGRLSLARDHRPYNVARDRSGPDSVPLATLADLEARGAFHEMASIYLAAGDLDRAAQLLDRAGSGPTIESDRAVIALARRRPAEAIDLIEHVLEQDRNDLAARWNRALALAELGLDLSAAAQFEQLAATKEPGWSEEAAVRARKIREAATARQTAMTEVERAGKAMIESGTPIPAALVEAHPDHARRLFYDAVRGAPDQPFLDRLAPVADQLDRIAGGTRLRDRLRIPALARRRDAAAAYREVMLGKPVPEIPAFLARMRSSGDPDLVVGALYTLGPFPLKETSELVTLAEAAGDPWFLLLAAQEQAALLSPADAEARLLALEPLCATGDRSLSLRCSLRDHFLGEGYAGLHRLDEARARAAAERARVRQARDWVQESAVIPLEAQIALLDGSYALAKAYLDETSARRPGECRVERFAHLALAQAAQNQLRPDRARAELAAAPRCDEPLSISALNVEADLVRSEPARAAVVREELTALRASAKGPGELARLDFLEGRLLSTTDAATAEPLLRAAIANAAGPDGTKVRGYAYSTLAVMASARGDHAGVVALLAEEAKQRVPASCALAITVDDERIAVAIISATGVAAGSYTARRAGPLTPSELVPRHLIDQLRACPEVAAFARPPLQGRPLLPPGIAFSFREGHAATGTSASTRLVIAAEDPPAGLGLPRLAGAGVALPNEVRIEGSAATPERSLAAMRDAGEVIIHAHGLVDLAVSSASHLVLSRDAGGRFALTADAIAAQQLAGKPVVVLAACRAAQPAAQVHAPWSLPSAFLRAGARAVLASTEPIPDRDSAAFFDDVLREIRGGKSPAVALESVRSRRRVAGEARAWFESIVVFE